MSRIGRMPIAIPAGVTVEVAENNKVTVKGPKGTLVRVLPSEMDIKVEGAEVLVSRPNDLKKMKSLHGLTRTLIHNMVVGVTDGYEKKLEVNGVGYRAAKSGKKLSMDRTSLLSRVLTKKKLANSQLKSETREDLSLIRARESSMPMRQSDVKLVRPVRNNR